MKTQSLFLVLAFRAALPNPLHANDDSSLVATESKEAESDTEEQPAPRISFAVASPERSSRERKVNCESSTRGKVTNFTPPADGRVKVAFFDADSTLRIAPSGSVSASSPTDVRLLPNVGRMLGQLQKKGYLIYIVSNQGGISAGVVDCKTAEGALRFTASQIAEAGGTVHGYDFAENADDYRKPGTGMAKSLEATLKKTYGDHVKIDKSQSFMVGDSAFAKASSRHAADQRWDAAKGDIVQGTHFSNADRLFAQAVGVHFYEPTDFFGWRKYGVDVLANGADIDALLKKCGDCTP